MKEGVSVLDGVLASVLLEAERVGLRPRDENTVQNIVFLVLYARERTISDAVRKTILGEGCESGPVKWYPERRSWREIAPDYKVCWFGAWSDMVAERLRVLSKLENAENLPDALKRKIRKTMKLLAFAESAEDVERVVDLVLGICDGFGKGLLFGVNLNEYIEKWSSLRFSPF